MLEEIIIASNKYKLSTYEIDSVLLDLIEKSINNISNKLIVNPKCYIYGKECSQHRSIGFFSDFSNGYSYSNQIMKSQPLTQHMKDILSIINNHFTSEFNGILINKYKDGSDYIGAHSDDESGLDKIGVIIFSYGANRKFRIRDKINKKIITDMITDNNKMIRMSGEFQKEFTHEIPIEKKIKEERYSITLRKHTI
tara:strand:+ start:4226 stop:4813 length:588 start_codon:yes stop_codon:yes gene_type:complete